jgi:hypothetical protein
VASDNPAKSEKQPQKLPATALPEGRKPIDDSNRVRAHDAGVQAVADALAQAA